MNIAEALEGKTVAAYDEEQLVQVTGFLTPDSDGDYIRVYPSPNSRSSYHRFNRNDVVQVIEWPQECLAHAQIVGGPMHSIQVKRGAQATYVTLSHYDAGVTTPNVLNRCGGCPTGETCNCTCNNGYACNPDSPPPNCGSCSCQCSP
jgi:hypothetical protein